MNKTQLRKRQKEIRQSLNLKQISSRIIERMFVLTEFQSAKNIFTYVPKFDEVDTSDILKIKNKNIFVPKVMGATMIMTEYTPEELVKNSFGIYEPKSINPVYPSEKDIIVLPALAVDLDFNRIGYGCGYYDKFLVKNKGIKIVLIPNKLIVDKITSDPHDIKVDIIVTENNVFYRDKFKHYINQKTNTKILLAN